MWLRLLLSGAITFFVITVYKDLILRSCKVPNLFDHKFLVLPCLWLHFKTFFQYPALVISKYWNPCLEDVEAAPFLLFSSQTLSFLVVLYSVLNDKQPGVFKQLIPHSRTLPTVVFFSIEFFRALSFHSFLVVKKWNLPKNENLDQNRFVLMIWFYNLKTLDHFNLNCMWLDLPW